MSKSEGIFDEYEDLYKLTAKTADDHIEFYKKKKSIPETELFAIWKKLSQQAENFSKEDWTRNWHNWDKNFHAFEKHQFEARFLIQHYLTDVLEELISRLVHKYSNMIEERTQRQRESNVDLSLLIKDEIKRQVKQELNRRQRTKKK